MLVKQYAVYKNGELIGIHTTNEIQQLIGINSKSVSRYCLAGRTYQFMYTFEEAGPTEADKVYGDLAKQWNEIRKCAKLIASGQAVIRKIGNEKFTCRRGKRNDE